MGSLPEHDAHLVPRVRPGHAARRGRASAVTVALARPEGVAWYVVLASIAAVAAMSHDMGHREADLGRQRLTRPRWWPLDSREASGTTSATPRDGLGPEAASRD